MHQYKTIVKAAVNSLFLVYSNDTAPLEGILKKLNVDSKVLDKETPFPVKSDDSVKSRLENEKLIADFDKNGMLTTIVNKKGGGAALQMKT